MSQVGRMLDDIEEDIRDDGFVVIKQPDIWGQARMTKYRVDFEAGMGKGVAKDGTSEFKEVLSAVIGRADRAALESATSLGAALTPLARAGRGGAAAVPGSATNVTITNTPEQIATSRDALLSTAAGLLKDARSGDPLDESAKAKAYDMLQSAASLYVKGEKSPGIALEPTVVLDEKKRYFDHLNEIRRVNMGDDVADSAGYGLTLMRLPVSIQPGERTLKDHGAQLTVTLSHEFGPTFLPDTFRNLVINDLVDLLGPVVFEVMREGKALENSRTYYDIAIKSGFPAPAGLRASSIPTPSSSTNRDPLPRPISLFANMSRPAGRSSHSRSTRWQSSRISRMPSRAAATCNWRSPSPSRPGGSASTSSIGSAANSTTRRPRSR
jgi:hypothetical protein